MILKMVDVRLIHLRNMKQKQSPIIPEHLHLLAIEVVQDKIDVQKFNEQKEYQLNVGHLLSHNLKEERVKLSLALSFENLNNERLFFFEIYFHFHIQHLSDFYHLKEDKTSVFYAPLIVSLLGMSFSTARGIIFEKLHNAGVKNVIIPIISPQKMLTPIQEE